MKRAVFLLLFLLSLFHFSSCSSESKVSVRIAIPHSPYIQNLESNYYKLWLEEKTGVEIEFVQIDYESAEEYLEVLFGSDNQNIDAVMFSSDFQPSAAVLEKFFSDGSILALNTLAGNSSNLAKFYEDRDGVIFSFPSSVSSRIDRSGQMLWINSAWLQNLNLTIPTNCDELKEVLLRFKNDDPNGNGKNDEIAMLGCNEKYSLQTYNFLLNAFVYNDPYHSRLYADNGKIFFSPTTDKMRQGLQYCAELYKNSLLDERNFTYTEQQIVQLANSPDTVVGCFSAQSIAEVLYQSNPEIMAQFIHVPPLQDDDGSRRALKLDPVIEVGGIISAKSEHAEDTFKVLDLMLSEEASLIARFGEEGTDWEFSNGGDISIYGTAATIITKNYIQNTIQNKHICGIGPIWLTSEYIDGVIWNGIFSDTEYITVRANMSYESFYPEETVSVKPSLMRQELDNYVDKSICEFINGSRDIFNNSEWERFIADCKKLECDKITMEGKIE